MTNRSDMRVALLMFLLAGCSALTEPSDRGASARSQSTPFEVGGGGTWRVVSAGFQHTCALDTTGAAWCWGSNQHDQLGVLSGTSCGDVGRCSRRPLAVGGGHTFIDIAAGTTHTCAVKGNGEVWCWGGGWETGNAGFLGTGTVQRSVAPVRVVADSAFAYVVVGAMNSCALTRSGQAWCWGRNQRGEVGDGTMGVARTLPVPAGGDLRFTQISLGGAHVCGLRVGRAYCWGYNRHGQLGAGPIEYNSIDAYALAPSRVMTEFSYQRIAAGGDHTCAIRVDGIIDCWGLNENAGQLGDLSGLTHRGVPGAIAYDSTYTTLAAGLASSCARTSSGGAFCWGSNYFGGIGNGRRSALPEQVPVQVLGGPFTQMSVGGSHSCGIDASQRLFCWGDRAYGQLGR